MPQRKKFSLKDNPLFKGVVVPEPPPSQESSPDNAEPEVPSSPDGSAPPCEDVQSPDSGQKADHLDVSSAPQLPPPQDVQEDTVHRTETDEGPLEGQQVTLNTRPSIPEGQQETLATRPSTLESQVVRVSQATQPPQHETPPTSILRSRADTNARDPQPAATKKAVKDSSASESGSPAHYPLAENFGKSLFFGFYNEISDHLLPTLPPTEQVIYARLFRLSYGFNRNWCTVSQPLLMEKTGLSRNTVRTSLQRLGTKGWIQVVSSGKKISTTYRVVLPREQGQGPNSPTAKAYRGAFSEGHNVRVTSRPSHPDPHAQRVSDSGSGTEPQSLTVISRASPCSSPEGHNRRVTHGVSDAASSDIPLPSNNMHARESTPDPQALPPLLCTEQDITLCARELVDLFYGLLGQKPSARKLARSIRDCEALLREGFARGEVEFAARWLAREHPETGSFSRLAHFIDQALKIKAKRDNERVREQAWKEQEARKREKQRRVDAERDKIEALREKLGPQKLQELEDEAVRILTEEQNVGLNFARDTIVRLKVNTLIQERYVGVSKRRDQQERSPNRGEAGRSRARSPGHRDRGSRVGI